MSLPATATDLILGRYRPLRPLGSGGMGQVWLARDERNGRDVALKIVAREGKAGSRAEREARAAAALRHDRCQRVLSLARDSSHVYIAYEYIPGRTLREALRGGALTDRDALEVAAQIAEALRHAHKRGIIHRDVKPANILLAESDEIDVRLLDFGLAQMEEFDTLTALGDIPGTLAYISPERLQGLPATTAADIWAVGVILFEALAGEHPVLGRRPGRDVTPHPGRCARPAHPAPRPPRARPPGRRERADGQPAAPSGGRRAGGRVAVGPEAGAPRGSGSGAKPGSLALSGLQLRKEVLTERVLPAALAGLATGWVASRLPFYPPA